MTTYKIINPQCRTCKLVDKIAGNSHPAYSEPRTPNLIIEIDNPFATISAFHEIERQHSDGFRPEEISIGKVDKTNAATIDISQINPKNLPKHYILAYNRNSIKAEEILNDYNTFLKTLERPPFPSDIQFKRGNRKQLGDVLKYLEGETKPFSKLNDRIYFTEKEIDEKLDSMLSSLNVFCVNYKVRL